MWRDGQRNKRFERNLVDESKVGVMDGRGYEKELVVVERRVHEGEIGSRSMRR